VLSLLPALFSLPFISQAIKSSSILKAVTKINLEVVATVVDATKARIGLVAGFRKRLIAFLVEAHGTDVVPSTAINYLFEEFNTTNAGGMTFEEFVDLVQGCHIHVSRTQAKAIYAEVDINRDGAVNMEVGFLSLSLTLSLPLSFSLSMSCSLSLSPSPSLSVLSSLSLQEFERFLFPQETLVNDQKKRKFFEAQNQKRLQSTGKSAAAQKIIKFLDPHLISKI
jgi:hypothetical protein